MPALPSNLTACSRRIKDIKSGYRRGDTAVYDKIRTAALKATSFTPPPRFRIELQDLAKADNEQLRAFSLRLTQLQDIYAWSHGFSCLEELKFHISSFKEQVLAYIPEIPRHKCNDRKFLKDRVRNVVSKVYQQDECAYKYLTAKDPMLEKAEAEEVWAFIKELSRDETVQYCRELVAVESHPEISVFRTRQITTGTTKKNLERQAKSLLEGVLNSAEWALFRAQKHVRPERLYSSWLSLEDTQYVIAREYDYPTWSELLHGVKYLDKEVPSSKFSSEIRIDSPKAPFPVSIWGELIVNDDLEVIRLWVTAYPISERGRLFETAIEFGCSLEVVQFFEQSGVDITSKAVVSAAERCPLKAIEFLVEQSGGIDKVDVDEGMYYAALGGRMNTVQYFLRNGANLDGKEGEGCIALHGCAAGGHTEVARYLLEKGASANTLAKEDFLPIYDSVEAGHIAVTELFLNKGADINLRDEKGETLLHEAIQGRRTSRAPWLPKGPSGCTHLEMVRFLISRGADVNAKDNRGCTPLYTVMEQALEYSPIGPDELLMIVRCLVEQGSNIHEKDCRGATPLYLAAEFGNWDIVSYLVERGSDIHTTVKGGRTLLHAACLRRGYEDGTEIVKFLLQRGLDVNAKDEKGTTVGHILATKPLTETLRIVLDAGLDIRAKSTDRRIASIPVPTSETRKIRPYKQPETMAQWAYMRGQLDILKLLSNYGVNLEEFNLDVMPKLGPSSRGGSGKATKNYKTWYK